METDSFGNNPLHLACMLYFPSREEMTVFDDNEEYDQFRFFFLMGLDINFRKFSNYVSNRDSDFQVRNKLGKTPHDLLLEVYERSVNDLPFINEKYPNFVEDAKFFIKKARRMLNHFENQQVPALLLCIKDLGIPVIFNILQKSFHFSDKRIAQIILSEK